MYLKKKDVIPLLVIVLTILTTFLYFHHISTIEYFDSKSAIIAIIVLLECVLLTLISSLLYRKRIRRMPVELPNVGETCYLNSMIQALASSDRLIHLYETIVNGSNQNPKMKLFLDLLKGLTLSEDYRPNYHYHINKERLLEFTTSISWNRASQQDAFHLLSQAINQIEADIKPYLAQKKLIMPPKFQMLHSFSENSQNNKIQNHLAFALHLCGSFKEKPGVVLEHLLDEYFKPSAIDGTEHTTAMHLFDVTPDVLILHIQANEWCHDRGEYIKPEYYIEYQQSLKYTFSIQRKLDGSKMVPIEESYQLVSVVSHIGNVSGGHYVTYRRCGQDWYLTNDEKVEEIIFNYDVIPYIMVYEKKLNVIEKMACMA